MKTTQLECMVGNVMSGRVLYENVRIFNYIGRYENVRITICKGSQVVHSVEVTEQKK